MTSKQSTSMTGSYRFKDITTIPGAKSLVDIVLSQTQRRTPTQVHPQFKISRIRNFYMRKVKYCQQTFHDKFTSILMEFPRLDDIHPFYSDLCNALYDRDHYKLALGQVNVVRGIIDRIAKDYVRLLKYADSPYKCKMLKRAGLGRMCTAVRKLGDSLNYLEEVRQHLSRLPSINPNTRTLLLTGYPNVGKSSFINSVTNANVEVQPYAFTTKSLYVGHFDYEYVRWQVIDTPGILDHPLAQRNTIELTAITALAHIQSVVLFFLDISEQCGFSLEHQVNLFHSIKVLFKNKPLLVVLNKCDVMKFDQLSPEKQDMINKMTEGFDYSGKVEMSCLLAEGVDATKNQACQLFLDHQAEYQVSSTSALVSTEPFIPKQVVPPASRPPYIPESVRLRREKAAQESTKAFDDAMLENASSIELARDIQEKCGGPGVYSIDLQADWRLKKDDWKYDIVPEMFNGKNIADFIDPEIDEKLRRLEEEEEKLLLNDSTQQEFQHEQWTQAAKTLQDIHRKIHLKRIQSRLAKNHAHRIMPSNKLPPKDVEETTRKLFDIGYHVEGGLSVTPKKRHSITKSLRLNNRQSSLADEDVEMEAVSDLVVGGNVLEDPGKKLKTRLGMLSKTRTKEFSASPFSQDIAQIKASIPNRITRGLPTNALRTVAEKIRRKREAGMKRQRKAGESDRFIGTKMPRHLYSGKRGKGKTDRR